MLFVISFLWAQKLLWGPMVGFTQMREVHIKLAAQGPVRLCYWDTLKPRQKFYTPTFVSGADSGYVVFFRLGPLEPGRTYQYEVFLGKKKWQSPEPLYFKTLPLWKWRTDPPSFRFAVGSCAYVNDSLYDRPGKPYGGEYEIFTRIPDQKPDFMLWLGDNIYLREADWGSWSGIVHRYTHTRSLPQLQRLWRSCAHYAIWDDHDYGPNDADRSFWNKQQTLAAFRLFWANPSYGVGDIGGIVTHFEWADAEFFLLDNRTWRSPNRRVTGTRQMLSKPQLEWLIDALKSSYATFKFIAVGGQVLNPHASYENFAIFPAERETLLQRIRQERITGVIFLTGDRHFTEITALPIEDNWKLYDITVSPLTASPFLNPSDHNPYRIPATFTTQRNFCIIEITGPARQREVLITCHDVEGKVLWRYTIAAKDLMPMR
ncbi:MAG: alkaline phosphatase D family protein [Bacteroidia bacterium]